jgi:hypothetical protein
VPVVRVKMFDQPIEVGEAEARSLRHQGLVVDEPAGTVPPAPATTTAPPAETAPPAAPAATGTPQEGQS